MKKEVDFKYVTYTVSSEEEFVKIKENILVNYENDKIYIVRKREIDVGLLKELPYRFNKKTKDFELNTIIYEVYNDEDLIKADKIIRVSKFNNKTFTIRKKKKANSSVTFFYNYDSNHSLEIITETWENTDKQIVKEIAYSPEMKELYSYEFEYHPDGTEKLWRLLDENKNMLEEEEIEL